MLKIIGGVLICTSLGLGGVIKAICEEQKLEVLNEYEKSLNLLKGEIKFSISSLPEAIYSVAKRTSGPVSEFYNSISEEIMRQPDIVINKIWERETINILKEPLQDNSLIELINELGSQLGHLDVEMQERSIELNLSRLQELQAKVREDIIKKSKLYKTMGIALGVLITIVLF